MIRFVCMSVHASRLSPNGLREAGCRDAKKTRCRRALFQAHTAAQRGIEMHLFVVGKMNLSTSRRDWFRPPLLVRPRDWWRAECSRTHAPLLEFCRRGWGRGQGQEVLLGAVRGPWALGIVQGRPWQRRDERPAQKRPVQLILLRSWPRCFPAQNRALAGPLHSAPCRLCANAVPCFWRRFPRRMRRRRGWRLEAPGFHQVFGSFAKCFGHRIAQQVRRKHGKRAFCPSQRTP